MTRTHVMQNKDEDACYEKQDDDNKGQRGTTQDIKLCNKQQSKIRQR
jgi:hypothetical protein